MRLVDLTTKPWQLMLPGEKETSLNKMVYLPGTLDEFGVGHEDRLDNSCHPDETTAQSFDDDVIATRFTRKHTYEGPAYFEQEITIAPADVALLHAHYPENYREVQALAGREILSIPDEK